jgi:putative nucleotidyltransferase with HDIG domain
MRQRAADFDPVGEHNLREARAREVNSLGGRERIVRWMAGLAFLAVSAPLAALAGRTAGPPTWVALLLVLSFAAAGRLRFESGPGYALATQLVFVEMLFVLPPAQVPLFAAAGTVCAELPEYVLGIHPVERAAVRLASSWFSLGPALVFLLAGPPQASLHARTLLVLAGALASQFAVDFAASAAQERAAFGVRPRELIEVAAWVLAIDLALTPIGLLAAIAARYGDAALVLPLPLLFVIGLSSRERQRRVDQALELSDAYRGTAFLLGDVVEATDEYTGAHSQDVLELVLAVCDELGVDRRSRLNAEFAALLHDVGKIRTPTSIITKPGALTPEERAIVGTHTLEGQRLLERVGGRLAEVGAVIRSCHERWDGAGYPDGLAGERIPLIARIVACCDAFSAMTTDRPYRVALAAEDAVAELAANAGTQFDPAVVEVLLRLVAGGRIGIERVPALALA